MAASDAKPLPRKNVAHRVYFPILDADGDPVADGTGLLGLVSTDAASFVTVATAPAQVSVSSGVYFCDLSASEMNGDGVVLKVTSSSAGAKATIIVMYPQDNSDIRVNVVEWASSPVVSVGIAGTPKVDVSHWLSTAAATPTVAGVPEVDVTHWIGTAAATPTVAGVPEVDVTHFGGSAGTFSSGRAEVNTSHWGGTAVASANVRANIIQVDNAAITSPAVTGVLNVNVSHFVGGAATASSGRPEVNTTHWGGTAVASANVRSNLIQVDNAPITSPAVAGVLNVNLTHWIGAAAATPTVAGVPEVDLTHVAGSTTNVAALATNVDAILTDTAEIGAAGAGLTAINLPDQTMNITGNITGNLSGSVGSVTAKVSANVIEWLSSPLVSVGVAGTPKVDVSHWLSTAAATPTVAGVPEVDVTHFGGSAGTFASGVPAVNSTQISGSAGSADRLERSTTAIVLGTVGTSSTTTAIKFSSLDPASAVNSQFVGRIITFDAATTTTALRGQATDITAWDHATLIATVTALTTAPASGDTCTFT